MCETNDGLQNRSSPFYPELVEGTKGEAAAAEPLTEGFGAVYPSTSNPTGWRSPSPFVLPACGQFILSGRPAGQPKGKNREDFSLSYIPLIMPSFLRCSFCLSSF